MSEGSSSNREGNLEAPTRHPLDWQNPEFYDEKACFDELERVFDICHGCRRCVSLCQSFPTLFDLVDESETMEVDGVDRGDYWKVVDECYLCDLCYMTKCPYVPPHPWNVDFPHLMLRAKAIKHKQGRSKTRDRFLTSTDAMGKVGTIPLVDVTVNAVNRNAGMRKLLEKMMGIHADAALPEFTRKSLRKRYGDYASAVDNAREAGRTTGKVALFTTCYGDHHAPDIGEDLIEVFEHNDIAMRLVGDERCCGMPKLELGDLDAVDDLKRHNIPVLAKLIDEGWDIIAPIPSCVLMFKQEIPLMYPDDEAVQKVREHCFDPFEYLMLRNREGLFNTDFKESLGTVAYQAACHQRVQNIGPKTKETFELVPDTKVVVLERCSGHDGTYAVKKETRENAVKIARPVVKRVKDADADYYTSDCVMAAHHIEDVMDDGSHASHPMALLRKAYGI